MKKIFAIIVMVIVTIGLSTTATAQQKPIGARIYTQAEMDSVKAWLSGLDDSTPVTMEVLRVAMTYAHDLTLRDGHREYVSMPGFFKTQVVKKIDGKIDNLRLMVVEEGGKIYSQINELDERVELLESVTKKPTASK